ncbi:YhgE/Pip family protein [Brevibacillus sp. SYSU BS000544]|uniref:YhgE/Pip family protein n=1 Tax=Brevibacillus sp. SYSU BS000544 TaxID=3416443 RepID=UPI003CE4C803
MKNIFSIYKTDIQKIVTNWVAAIVILGLVFLPSLYAWFNIEASWDPYGQTSGITVAVSNNDKGAVVRGKAFNIGNEIITSLKENQKIGWVFVDENQALKGVQHGDYYASITIPADFSERMSTVLTDNPQKAEIIYTVNEKINAISPKITAKGASGIIDEVSRNFVKTANGAIFRVFNEIGVELESELPTIERLIQLVFKLESLFPLINSTVSTGLDDIHKANQIVQKAQHTLPVISQLAKDSTDFTVRMGQFLDQSSATLETIAPQIKQDLLLLQQIAIATNQITGILQDAELDPKVVTSSLERISIHLTRAISLTERMILVTDRLHSLSGLQHPSILSPKLHQLGDKLEQQLATVTKVQDAINKGEKPAAQLIDDLQQLSQNVADSIDDILLRYDSAIQPQILQAIDKAKKANQRIHTILVEANDSLPNVQTILNKASNGLAIGDKELSTIQENLPATEAKVKDLANRIRKLQQEGNLNELIDLLKNNAQKESEFFAEPVVLKENKLFPIPNYGSAMSPFFTTLSLWVGALLLVSLLSVEVHHSDKEYRSYEVYFGRYLTFLTLALLQSIMVTAGDIYILGAYVVDKVWFVLFGLILSSVFMLIVYTLVSVFGNVGKAMAIVMLVLQLAGSGGTFPIQVTPPFFQAIHPYLPFTYAISMMREAVGGILWDIVQVDLIMMGLFVSITLVIGLALKNVINQTSAPFVKKAKESKLIH